MANSEYEYTRLFERPNHIIPNTWIVVRIDGHAFHKLSAKYEWKKPNDDRALNLMNHSAQAVIEEMPDICVAYGHSDEYSFVFHPACRLFERREAKLVSTIVSIFTAHYIHGWPSYFPEDPLSSPLPSFDGRAVIYPSLENLRHYLSWRQVDCHINNQYNTTFWALVNMGAISRTNAEKQLSGTFSADKNEILFSRFGINYSKELAIHRKGSVLYHDYYIPEGLPDHSQHDVAVKDKEEPEDAPKPDTKFRRRKLKSQITLSHIDVIGKDFWDKHPWILAYGAEKKKVLKDFFESYDSEDHRQS